MRVFATAAVAAFVAMVAWSSSAQAVDVEIHGYPFGCKTPDGETRKPKFGDVGGMYFAGLPQGRKACLETIDRMIYSCGANTTFISHDLNNQYADCLPIFEQQAEWCARHFELQRSKCDAGGSSAPAESSEAAAEPAVEPADATMWALKRSNIRSGPGTDHAKVGLLDVGDEVQVTGETGDWLRIDAPGGSEAFVYGPLLGEEAPEQETTAAEREPDVPSGTPSREQIARAWDIPDKTTRERVAAGLNRCISLHQELVLKGAYSDTFRSDENARKFIRKWNARKSIEYFNRKENIDNVIAAAREYMTACMPVAAALRKSGLSCGVIRRELSMIDSYDRILRDPGSYLSMDGLGDTNRDTIVYYLEKCVPVIAAAMDGGSLELVAGAEGEPTEFATTAPAPEAAPAGPLHGSITFSQEADGGYAWGIAWSFDSHAGALAEATDQCHEYGGTGCEEAGWFENACGALAVGDGNGYGTGGGATTAEAERDALRECRAANADCRVEVARCSQSEEAGGRVRVESKTVTIVGYDLNQFSCVTDRKDMYIIPDVTLEIPRDSSRCASLYASVMASCVEMCGHDELQQENKRCVEHYLGQYEKCGPAAVEWYDPRNEYWYSRVGR